jgi:hypothetical protein
MAQGLIDAVQDQIDSSTGPDRWQYRTRRKYRTRQMAQGLIDAVQDQLDGSTGPDRSTGPVPR